MANSSAQQHWQGMTQVNFVDVFLGAMSSTIMMLTETNKETGVTRAPSYIVQKQIKQQSFKQLPI